MCNTNIYYFSSIRVSFKQFPFYSELDVIQNMHSMLRLNSFTFKACQHCTKISFTSICLTSFGAKLFSSATSFCTFLRAKKFLMPLLVFLGVKLRMEQMNLEVLFNKFRPLLAWLQDKTGIYIFIDSLAKWKFPTCSWLLQCCCPFVQCYTVLFENLQPRDGKIISILQKHISCF